MNIELHMFGPDVVEHAPVRTWRNTDVVDGHRHANFGLQERAMKSGNSWYTSGTVNDFMSDLWAATEAEAGGSARKRAQARAYRWYGDDDGPDEDDDLDAAVRTLHGISCVVTSVNVRLFTCWFTSCRSILSSGLHVIMHSWISAHNTPVTTWRIMP